MITSACNIFSVASQGLDEMPVVVDVLIFEEVESPSYIPTLLRTPSVVIVLARVLVVAILFQSSLQQFGMASPVLYDLYLRR